MEDQGRNPEYIKKVQGNSLGEQGRLDYFIVDTYDSDELTVVAFSNGIKHLTRMFTLIRCLSVKEIDECAMENKHVFAACYSSFGYDVDFGAPIVSEEVFIPPITGDNFKINCLCETKPGHREEFCKLLSGYFPDLSVEKTISGGSVVIARIGFEVMEKICGFASDAKSGFRNHLIRIKITLGGVDNDSLNQEQWMHDDDERTPKATTRISMKDKWALKSYLISAGVSKIERERLLSLCDLYNDCESNRLQSSFFHDLLPSLKTFGQEIVPTLADNNNLSFVETVIDEEVSSLECAMYNRMHNRMAPNAVLEYCGGVQQYVKALEYAYRVLVKMMAPDRAKSQYICISGTELVSSTATHFDMNINHILYPQLFATIAWKEAANFAAIRGMSFENLDKTMDAMEDVQDVVRVIEIIRRFLKSPESAKKLQAVLTENVSFIGEPSLKDEICKAIDEHLLNYAIADFEVFHFAFQRDFKLMWYYYWAIFLQTASTYGKKSEMRRRKFVMFLLRLFIVACLDIDNNGVSKWDVFLDEHKDQPFDYILAKEWLFCYDRLLQTARTIVGVLAYYNIFDALDATLMLQECSLADEEGIKVEKQGDILETAISHRRSIILHLTQRFKNGEVITSDSFDGNVRSATKVVCLMSAYLNVVRDLVNTDAKIMSVPRIVSIVAIRDMGHDHNLVDLIKNSAIASPLLSDPGGGFLTLTPDVRKAYFLYNTIYHRALWDLSCYKS